jgi:hypothetical protein
VAGWITGNNAGLRAVTLLAAVSVVATLGARVVSGDEALAAPVPAAVRTAADATARAVQTGEPVEIPDRTTETSQTFANPDGSLTDKVSNSPVRVRQGDNWRAVDTTLEFRPDGSVGPKAALSDITLSAGGKGLLAKVGVKDGTLQLQSPWSLSRPTLSGSKATYPDVIAGVDLVTEATTDGFTYNLVVKNREAAENPALKSIHFPVASTGLSLRANRPSGPAYVAQDGRLVMTAGSAIMWDSAKPGPQAKAAQTASSAQLVDDGPRGAHVAKMDLKGDASGLTVVPNAALLTAASTVYPLVLDPVISTPSRSAWAAAWQLYPTTSFYKTTHSLGVGYENYEQHKIVRSFFQFNTAVYAGKKIFGATLRTYETHSASCVARSVTVTRTAPISAATTWNNQPAVQLAAGSKSFANGYNSSCPDAYVEIPVTNSMVDTAAKGYSTSTFRLSATDETDGVAWKQFSSFGELQISYLSQPAVPRRLGLTDPEVGCGTATSPDTVDSANLQFGVMPMLTANDPGNRVRAELQIYSSSGNPFITKQTALDSQGTPLTLTIPITEFPDQVTYHFRARTLYPYNGGVLTSGYTIWCYFKVDRLAPPSPIVTAKYGSVTLTNCRQSSDTCPEIVPSGGTVSYTIKGAVADVIRQEYYFQGAKVRSKVNGNTVTVNLVPSANGYNTLYAVSYDAAGHASAPALFMINLKSAAPPVGAWSFDDGGSGVTASDSATPAHPLTLSGGATFDDAGRDGGSIQLDGVDDYAETPTTVVDTSQSFTVSAWARLTSAKEAVVVGAAGSIGSAFELYYSVSLNRWVFMRMKTDTMSPVTVKALSDEPAVLGAWTLVTGVYDANPVAPTIKLYINGRLQTAGNVAYPDSAWKATGPLSVGQGQYNDVFGSRFAGSLDAVRIWQRPLTADAVMSEVEIRKADKVVAGRAARWPLDGATLGADQVWRTEDTIYGVNMVISGFGGGIDPSAAFVEDDDHGRVLQFSGAASEALSLPRAVVDGGTSFSAAVWVKLDDASKPAVIARQAGPDRDAWRLEWKPITALNGQWTFTRTPSDSTEASVAVFEASIDSVSGYWHLVVGTYDASAENATGSGQLGEIGVTVNKRAKEDGRDEYLKPYRLGSTVVGKGRTAGAEFAGQLDDFRLYTGPLLDDAICGEFDGVDNCPVPAE